MSLNAPLRRRRVSGRAPVKSELAHIAQAIAAGLVLLPLLLALVAAASLLGSR